MGSSATEPAEIRSETIDAARRSTRVDHHAASDRSQNRRHGDGKGQGASGGGASGPLKDEQRQHDRQDGVAEEREGTGQQVQAGGHHAASQHHDAASGSSASGPKRHRPGPSLTRGGE